MTYTFATVINQEGTWFVARAVDLGVVSQGKSVSEALVNLKEAATLYLENNPQSKKLASKIAPLVTTLELNYA